MIFLCGFCGFMNKSDLVQNDKIICSMVNRIKKRGPNAQNVYIDENVAFGHARLSIIDVKNGNQPMIKDFNNNKYVIIYNGELYNTKELRDDLISKGYTFSTSCDTEVVLNSYIHYGDDCVNLLNGIFAFAIYDKFNKNLFLARDRLGIKPLFYTISSKGTFIFSSEIKGLLEHPEVDAIIDKECIMELFGLGPAHTPGRTFFKNIYEIKAGFLANYSLEYGLVKKMYWDLKTKENTDTTKDAIEQIHNLLCDATKRQLVSDVGICSMLSGGLDSSIITKFASDYYETNSMPVLDTYSVDYVDNDKNFVKSDFQPNSDNYYINLMVSTLHTNHHSIILDTPELADNLYDAMLARDMPGMADVDSSLLLFCKNVKPTATVSLTGECADEIFGGYPWFFRDDALNSGTFPWSIAINERQTLLNPSISKKINLKEYIDFRYNESLSNVEILDSDSAETTEKRKISYLTLNWFMQTLLDRSDRMSMYNGFELRVPFCDYRLAQYVWNIPWEIKALNGREKGLLRYISRKFLPAEIVDRKKSPYPKTWNPTYLATVKDMLTKIMNDSNAPINNLLNRNYILEILETDGKAFTRPWFGQLMTGPQLMAYLCQVNMWLERYNPSIEI